MADSKRAAPLPPDETWPPPEDFETTGYRPRPRRPDPRTGKLPEIRPPKGGSSVQPPRDRPAGKPKAPPRS